MNLDKFVINNYIPKKCRNFDLKIIDSRNFDLKIIDSRNFDLKIYDSRIENLQSQIYNKMSLIHDSILFEQKVLQQVENDLQEVKITLAKLIKKLIL